MENNILYSTKDTEDSALFLNVAGSAVRLNTLLTKTYFPNGITTRPWAGLILTSDSYGALKQKRIRLTTI